LGFGFGWGWGWGWGYPWWGPGWGWGWYDWPPYWYDYPGYGGYYDYGPPYAPPPDQDQGYGDYGDYDSYGPPYAAPPDSGAYAGPPASAQNPQDQYAYGPGPATGDVAESMPTVLLYMTDGTVYPATQYWVSGSTVHYVVAYGGENTVPIADIDMQRTIDENAKRGVRFDLRPRSYSDTAPPTTSVPAAPPAPAKGQPIAQLEIQLQPAA
jgi:hypothetical protein